MTAISPKISALKELIACEEKRATIQGQLNTIDQRIASLRNVIQGTGGDNRNASRAKVSAAPATRRKRSAGPKKGSKRGAWSASILEHLKSAGAAGVKIGDLAEKLGAKYKNVYIWFATTGKKNPKIKRTAPATYRLFN